MIDAVEDGDGPDSSFVESEMMAVWTLEVELEVFEISEEGFEGIRSRSDFHAKNTEKSWPDLRSSIALKTFAF